MNAFWNTANRVTGYRAGTMLRCDGYRPVGPVDGRRTHMAQYCLRWRLHDGMCLAKVTSRGEVGTADFHPVLGGPAVLP
jgi:hypothetical protein